MERTHSNAGSAACRLREMPRYQLPHKIRDVPHPRGVDDNSSPCLLWHQIKSIGVPFSDPMAADISIGRSLCHILCHVAIIRTKSAQDGQKDSYSHPLYCGFPNFVLGDGDRDSL